jgi:energy-coupling factor transport system ATP-binding protein
VIETEALWHTYDGRRYVLRDVSVRFETGKYIAVMGENGAGKSTLVKHFNGLLKPSKGRVLVDGVDTREIPTSKLARRVALVFQYPESMFFSETVREEVQFALKNFGYSEETVEGNTRKYLTIFGLEDFMDRSPFTLSGGEQRRLALACILAWEPDYIVLDEPTAGQDKYQRELLEGIIRQLIIQGRTVIIVSHDVEFVAETSPEVYVMAEGEVKEHGSAKRILSDEDLITSVGLILPQVTETFHRLKGYGLPQDVLSPREAVEELFKILRGATDV